MATRRKETKSLMNKPLITVMLLALAISISLNIYNFYFYNRAQSLNIPLPSIAQIGGNVSNATDLSTTGFTRVSNISVQEFSDHGDIILASGCTGLRGSVDTIQGQSVIDGLNGVTNARPNAHDLIRDVFNVLGVKVLMVKVVGINANNYIGKLIIQQGSKIASLDSRPSDGIAIAVRVNASVYVNSTLLAQKGENIC